jgi:1-acyl-sn-glycerol-3-phosphate acyltransferase
MGMAILVATVVFFKKNRIVGYIIFVLCRPLAKILGIHLQIENKDCFKEGPGIIVANHQSYFDALFIPFFIPAGTVTIGKKSIIYIPFFGLAYYLMGNVLVDRTSRKGVRESLAKVLKFMHRTGDKVLFFPEGTRNYGEALGPFKNGAFRLAIDNHLPVYVVAITNIKNIDLNRMVSKITIHIWGPLVGTDTVELKDKSFSLINDYLNQSK